MTRVIIDAGHGGTSRAGSSSAFGSRGPTGLIEKDIALDIARHVVQRLGNGARLTRAGDTNLTLGARASQARDSADVFVSIHANSGPPDASGPETFVHPEAGPDSHRLAESVQHALERLRGRYGGVGEPRSGSMAVLNPRAVGRATSACLVEVDYLSNPDSERRLRDPGHRHAIGAAIASAIQDHVQAKKRTGGAAARALDRPSPDPYIIPDPSEYVGTGLLNFVRGWATWFGRWSSWRTGVPSAAYEHFPHSAICELEMTLSDGGTAFGTGFFIGRNKLLTCGHNFKEGSVTTTSIIVRPGKDPTRSLYPEATFTISNFRDQVHPRWAASEDNDWDMAVLRTPGLDAPGGRVFTLPTMCPAADEKIVVCGYGKFTNLPFADQGQYLDGGTITQATADQYFFPIQAIPGHSGSPVFWNDMVVAILTGPRLTGSAISDYENRGVMITPAKNDWINSK
ncbi:MAG TPA: N-acetylmuramoyl-L-alanine amidase [Kofleriaceae bacterium]|nr:N-acetylmuramoyl-L-alanine amidase [Kofleriaceae bacterium]